MSRGERGTGRRWPGARARAVATSWAALLAAGCVALPSDYPCESAAQCVRGELRGVCDEPGYCSFADPSCAGGRRFGDHASALSGTCVSAADDAAAPAPVSHWRFDETAGATAADSIGDNPGTLINGPLWITGRVGGAVALDGVDDSILVAHDPTLDLVDALTIEAWIQTDVTELAYIVAKNEDYLLAMPYALLLGGTSPGGKLGAILQDTTYDSDYIPPIGEWTHVAMAWDGATVRLFANGVEVAALAHTATPAPNTWPLRIGARGDEGGATSTLHFQGAVDEVRIWNRALAPDELAAGALAASGR
jgi:hypothetical protein